MDRAKAWCVPAAVGLGSICYAFIVLSFTITTVWAVASGLGSGPILAGLLLVLWIGIALLTCGLEAITAGFALRSVRR